MKNWKTTIVGVIGAMLNAAITLYQTGTIDAKTVIISAALAGLGFLAKDLNVTGGSVSQ